MEKNYRLKVVNYYEWKNFREKGITITVTCGKKKGLVHGTGHTPIKELVRKISALVYGEEW